MITLRRLESQLNLPKPDRRTEADLGYNKDSKGALHYDRHIALSYKDSSVLDILRIRLLEDSWEEKTVNSYGLSTYYFKFTKGSGDATLCVNGFLDSQDTDGAPLYVSLQASGEYSCNPAPGM